MTWAFLKFQYSIANHIDIWTENHYYGMPSPWHGHQCACRISYYPRIKRSPDFYLFWDTRIEKSSITIIMWWYYRMGVLPALQPHCEWKPLVIGGFSSQRTSYEALMFSLLLDWTNCLKTMELPVMWDNLRLLWHHSNDPNEHNHPTYW